jgi:hypothetical protein
MENPFRKLIDTIKQHAALHVSLEIKMVRPINDERRELVQLKGSGQHVKLFGTTADGIECYVEIELLGKPDELERFHFTAGKHAGLVLRTID